MITPNAPQPNQGFNSGSPIPLDPISALLAALGIGGALAGAGTARDNYGQAQEKLRDVQSWTSYGEKSELQELLEAQSEQSYYDQGYSADMLEDLLNQSEGTYGSSIGMLEQLMAGQGWDMTDEEFAQNNAMRDAQYGLDQTMLDQLLDQSLGQTEVDLARRNVRGQAANQMRVGTVNSAAQTLQDRLNAANQAYSDTAMQMPKDRLTNAGRVATNNVNQYGQNVEQLFDARMALQNPMLLQQLRKDRQNSAVQHGPDAAYGQAVMGGANIPSDWVAAMSAYNQSMSGMGAGLGQMGGMGPTNQSTNPSGYSYSNWGVDYNAPKSANPDNPWMAPESMYT